MAGIQVKINSPGIIPSALTILCRSVTELLDSDQPYHQKSKFILFKNFAKQDQDVFAG